MRSSNVSALLAKKLAFHNVYERDQTDAKLVNKRLIQRCANALTRDREFSAPEIISYLMGWGDRYESHTHVAIFWDAAVHALKEVYRELIERYILNNFLRNARANNVDRSAVNLTRDEIESQDPGAQVRMSRFDPPQRLNVSFRTVTFDSPRTKERYKPKIK